MGVTVERLGQYRDALLANIAPDVFDDPILADLLAAHMAAPGQLMLLAFGGHLLGRRSCYRRLPAKIAYRIDRLAQAASRRPAVPCFQKRRCSGADRF
jgi:hypothetical protein